MTGLNSYHNSFYVQGHMGLLQMWYGWYHLHLGCEVNDKHFKKVPLLGLAKSLHLPSNMVGI